MKVISLAKKAVEFSGVNVKEYPEYSLTYLAVNIRNNQAVVSIEESEALRKILLQRNAVYKKIDELPKPLEIRERKKHTVWETRNTHSKSKSSGLVYRVCCHKLNTRAESSKQFTVSTASTVKDKKAARLAATRFSEKNRKAFNKIRDVYTRMMTRSFNLACAEEARTLEPLLHKLETNRDEFWRVAFDEVFPLGLVDPRVPI